MGSGIRPPAALWVLSAASAAELTQTRPDAWHRLRDGVVTPG